MSCHNLVLKKVDVLTVCEDARFKYKLMGVMVYF
jgi:hypothetical protein